MKISIIGGKGPGEFNARKRQYKNALFQLGELKKHFIRIHWKRLLLISPVLKMSIFMTGVCFNELQVEFSTADDIQHLIQESTFSIQRSRWRQHCGVRCRRYRGPCNLWGVGLAGTASTGTAIATLNGVALTNATLAWLGGGSLAAGGLGVAGGMAILGGIVAAPVLAIGGMFLSSKAEVALEEARANASKAELIVEELKASEIKVRRLRSSLLK